MQSQTPEEIQTELEMRIKERVGAEKAVIRAKEAQLNGPPKGLAGMPALLANTKLRKAVKRAERVLTEKSKLIEELTRKL